MLAEVVLSIYLSYQLFGLWWFIGFVLALTAVTVISAWTISAIHINAHPIKELKTWSQQNSKAKFIFYSISENVLFFPIRSVIVYYVYSEYQHGVLYILLYLLFLVGDSRAWQQRNTMEANIALDEIRKNT